MTTPRFDLEFPHDYEVEMTELHSAPSHDANQIYFPRNVEDAGRDGLIVKLSPNDGVPWLGIFAFGYRSPRSLTGVYSCPNRRSVCVVAQGAGYVVRTDDPNIWEQVRCFPIVDVRTIRARNLLIFAGFTTLAAYGINGFVWETDRLSWDMLKITDVTETHIRGLAWDSPQDREVEFVVDLVTGSSDGGSSPERYQSTKE